MKFAIKYNPDNKGLRTIFRHWQIKTLRLLWTNKNKRLSTKDIWTQVKRESENGVSRATVYHFLDGLAEKGIVEYDMGSGRGGIKILFYSVLSEEEFKKRVGEALIQSIQVNLLDQKDVTG